MPALYLDLRSRSCAWHRRLRTERASDTLIPSQLAVLATLMREGLMCPTAIGWR